MAARRLVFIAAYLLSLSGAAAAQSILPWAEFAPREGWAAWWPAEQGPAPFRVKAAPEDPQTGISSGITIAFGPRSRDLSIPLYSGSSRTTAFTNPAEMFLSLAVEKSAADGAPSASLLFKDASGAVKASPALIAPDGSRPMPMAQPWTISGASGPWTLWEVGIFVPKGSAPMTLRLGGLSVRAAAAAAPILSSRLIATDANGLHHRRPGDQTSIRFVISGPPLANVSGTITSFDWSGSRLAATKVSSALDARGRLIAAIPSNGPLGLRNIIVDLKGAAGLSCLRRHTVAVFKPVPPAPPTEQFVPGLQGENPDKWIHAAAMVGAGLFRTSADLREIRPIESMAWSLDAFTERIKLIESLKMRPQVLLAYGIPWAMPPRFHKYEKQPDGSYFLKTGWPDGFVYPPREDVWRPFVREVAAGLRGRRVIYEVWNEPDITPFWRASIADYLDLLKQSSQEIRAADPTAIVGTGGFAFPPFDPDPYGFGNPGLQEAVLRDGRSLFDFHVIHLHGDYGSFRHQVDNQVLPSRQRLGVSQPLLFNESSFSAHQEDQEMVQAGMVAKKMVLAWSRGAAGLLWFRTWMTPDDAPGECGYSMFRGHAGDAEPKAVWPAYAAFARAIRGHRFVRELRLGPAVHGFEFARGAQRLAIVWKQDEAAAGPARVSFRLGRAAIVEAMDIMGNRGPLKPSQAGVLELEVTGIPTYLVAAGSSTGFEPTPGQGQLP